jgi:hypothetical protein
MSAVHIVVVEQIHYSQNYFDARYTKMAPSWAGWRKYSLRGLAASQTEYDVISQFFIAELLLMVYTHFGRNCTVWKFTGVFSCTCKPEVVMSFLGNLGSHDRLETMRNRFSEWGFLGILYSDF